MPFLYFVGGTFIYLAAQNQWQRGTQLEHAVPCYYPFLTSVESTSYIAAKVGRGNSGHRVIRATSTLQQERSIHWILASSQL